MDHSSYNQEICEFRELKANGYFHKAAKKLEELLRTNLATSSELVIELADTLFLQGFYGLALEHIEEHLRQSTENQSQADAALRMMRAFARAHVEHIFGEGLELVQIYEGTRNYTVGSESADALVRPCRTIFV